MKKWVLLFLALSAPSARAQTASVRGTLPAPRNPWSAVVSADQYLATDPSQDPYTLFTLDTRYDFNRDHRLQFIVPVTKLYTINPGESEVRLEDLSLFY